MFGGFGSGGRPNVLPSRTIRKFGSDNYTDLPEFAGGQRGPAALPSRVIEGGAPAPAQRLVGWWGAIPNRRAASVEDAGAPRLSFDSVLGHGDIPWDRPTYPNIAGLRTYMPPPTFHRGSQNSIDLTEGPADPIPFTKKHIGSFTVRRPYGDNSAGVEFTSAPLDGFVDALPTGMAQQGRRWRAQSKTQNPVLYNRSVYSTAGSYGQTTSTLPTGATNTPAGAGMGAY